MLVSNGDITNLPKQYLSEMLQLSVVTEEEHDYGHCPLCINWETGETYCRCKICCPDDPYYPGGDHYIFNELYDNGKIIKLIEWCIIQEKGEEAEYIISSRLD